MEWKRVEELTRHIHHVQQDCLLLGQKLHEKKEYELSRKLIANGQVHDNSKFFGIEWEFLFSDVPEEIAIAVKQHNQTNLHHPEAWGKIQDMPPLYIAEMVCDWRARSSEFGSSLMEWVEKEARKRYKFTKRDRCYEDITGFVNLLLSKEFEPLPDVGKKD